MKPEMFFGEAPKLVTSLNHVEFKVQWLKWWNSSLILWYSNYFPAAKCAGKTSQVFSHSSFAIGLG
jgi:hypothetical protein